MCIRDRGNQPPWLRSLQEGRIWHLSSPTDRPARSREPGSDPGRSDRPTRSEPPGGAATEPEAADRPTYSSRPGSGDLSREKPTDRPNLLGHTQTGPVHV